MNNEDKRRFAAIMCGLAANYGRELDKTGLAFFFRMLTPFPIEAVEAAAMSIAATRKYTSMPTVADFIEHLQGGSIDDFAEVEAGKVLNAIARHGSYQTVAFDDATTQAVIVNAYGGWIQLCEECGTEENEKWFRKEFIKTWIAYKRRGVALYGSLPGRTELANRCSPFQNLIPAPILIGNPQAAANVLEKGKEGNNAAVAALLAPTLAPSLAAP